MSRAPSARLPRVARAATLALALAATGCLRGAVLEARIAEARSSAEALETLGDPEVARAGFEAQLAELEGLHRLAPGEEDALFALVRAWTVYGTLFLADAREAAESAGDVAAARALELRERHALERAIGFGMHALARRGAGLEEARRTRDALSRWTDERLSRTADAELAFWVGRAWIARARLGRGDPLARKFEPFVGAVLLERSHRGAPGYARYGAQVALASLTAEAPSAAEEARRSYAFVLEKTQRRALWVHVEYALSVGCATGDAALYERLLTEVLASVDPGLDDRLANHFARRRARRALEGSREKVCASR